MKKFLDKYSLLEERILIVSLAFNTLLVFFQIIMRTVFNTSLAWSEELSRYIFIWQIWIGASVAYSHDAHIQVDLIYSIVKGEKGKKIIKIIVDILWLAFNIFLVVSGFELCKSMLGRNVLSSGMRIPLVYIYLVLPLSSLALSIKIMYSLVLKIKNFSKKEINMEVN